MGFVYSTMLDINMKILLGPIPAKSIVIYFRLKHSWESICAIKISSSFLKNHSLFISDYLNCIKSRKQFLNKLLGMNGLTDSSPEYSMISDLRIDLSYF